MRKITLVTSFLAGVALVLFGAAAASAAPSDTTTTFAMTAGSLAISEPTAAAWLRGVPDSRDF
jgi:hypothetical protein